MGLFGARRRWLRGLAVVGWLLHSAAARGVEGVPAGWSPPAPWSYQDGRFEASVASSEARLLVPGSGGLRDGTVGVTLSQVAGELRDLRLGLLYGARDTANAAFVLLRGDGSYWLGRLDEGKPVVALTGHSVALRAAEPNRLEVARDHGRETILVNGRRLLNRPAEGDGLGAIGLWISGSGTGVFVELDLRPAGSVPAVSDPAVSNGGPSRPTPPTRPAVAPELTLSPSRFPASPRFAEASAPPPAPATIGAKAGLPTTPSGPLEAAPRLTEVAGRTEPELLTAAVAVVMPPGSASAAMALPPAEVGSLAATPKALFAESFDPPSHEWNEDAFRRIENGELHIRAVSGYKLSGFPFDYRNYTYRARARALTPHGGTYGLVARLQPDGSSGYLFVVRDPDVYAVARLDGGKPVLLRRGNAALGAGWNQLAVRCVGADLAFSINDSVVASLEDDRYPRGGIGLWVDEHRQAAFDDLLVEAVEPGPRPPGDSGQPGAAAVAVLLEEHFDPPTMPWQQDAQREIRDGALELRAPYERFVISGVADGRFVDYQVTVAVESVGGPGRGRYGLVARLQPDGRTGYLFAIAGAGRFVVLRLDPQGAAKELARGEAPLSAGINQLGARCEGERIAFDVNGAEVVTVKDSRYSTGGFGLYVDNGAHARFDDLIATTLRPVP